MSLQTNLQCGTNGAACSQCGGSLMCAMGVCTSGGTCDATSCPNGCCAGGVCVPFAQQNTNSCGNAGAACGTCASNQTCQLGACAAQACNNANCPSGCCSNGLCVPFVQQSNSQCGSGGLACSSCTGSSSCTSGVCVAPPDAGPAGCDYTNCAGCCVGNTCMAVSAETNSQCGNNGVACGACQNASVCSNGVCVGGTTCNATNCNGCCNGNTCVTTANQSASVCGVAASACGACSTGKICQAGQCVAQVAPTCLVIAPDDIDFRNVQATCKSYLRTVNVYNVCGDTTVTLSSITSNSAEFPVTAPTLPVNIAADGAPLSFTVRYAPTGPGLDSSSITFGVTQYGQSVAYQAAVMGTGDSVGQVVDTFTVPTKADVLLTIDDSCSMSDKQMAVASNFTSFLSHAFDAGIDFQIAATTTDDDDPIFGFGGEQGRFVGDAGMLILRNTTPNLSAEFSNKVNLGVNGSGIETGLSPSWKATSVPLSTTTNAGFLRGDSALGVVVVTDALDQAVWPPGIYYDGLRNVKGARQPNLFSFNGMIAMLATPPATCSYDNGTPEDGKYGTFVDGTGGTKTEICSSNYPADIAQLGTAAFGQRSTWYLLAPPDLTGGRTLSVAIDGVAVPASGYTYDSVGNAVVFPAAGAPRPGQKVTIAYTVPCL